MYRKFSASNTGWDTRAYMGVFMDFHDIFMKAFRIMFQIGNADYLLHFPRFAIKLMLLSAFQTPHYSINSCVFVNTSKLAMRTPHQKYTTSVQAYVAYS